MKLKFLAPLSEEKVNYREILKERLGLKKVRWYHAFYFLKTVRQLTVEIEALRNLNPKEVKEVEGCKIKRPGKIDQLPYGAMVELQVLFQNPGDRDICELITQCIAVACYHSHTDKDFDSDKKEFQDFIKHIGEQDLVSMLGLYNWIDREINASVAKWNQLFKQVEVHDQDWDNAGGHMMSKFDVLSTIEKTCLAFNVDYKGALQMSYGLVQANNLKNSTRAFIQDKMRQNLEIKMKAKRKEH